MAERLTVPGFVDLHVHLREPGNNKAETVASGTRAALLGGYVFLADMSNNPGRETWYVERMLEKHDIFRRDAYIPVTANMGSQPAEDNLSEIPPMSRMSLEYKGYTGKTTSNLYDYSAQDFRSRLQIFHKEAPDKVFGLHAGKNNLADFIGYVAKDLGQTLLVHHLHTEEEVNLVKWAKKDGLPVFGEVTVHHLLKTSHDARSEGWFARMVPPLVDQVDSEMLMYHLANGTVDTVGTDHAPHAEASKWSAELDNPDGREDADSSTCFGVPAIDFAASLMFYQAKRGLISMERVVDAMSTRPAEVIGVKLDPRTRVTWEMDEYRIEESMVESGSGWSPFLGKLAVGHPVHIQIGEKVLLSGKGNIVAKDSRAITERGAVI